jgi:hypothetical protein
MFCGAWGTFFNWQNNAGQAITADIEVGAQLPNAIVDGLLGIGGIFSTIQIGW